MKICVVRRAAGRVLLNVDGIPIWIEVGALASSYPEAIISFDELVGIVLSQSE